MTQVIELGCPGHFICAKDCRWRRHTQVGLYRISTVGDFYIKDIRKTLGAGEDSFFETLVFKTDTTPEPGSEDCGCLQVIDWGEIDGKRYATAGAAQEGHEAFVKKYAGGSNV